jgi:hypothetical protein
MCIASTAVSSVSYGITLEESDPILFHNSSFVENKLAIGTKNGSWVDLVLVSEPVQAAYPIHKHNNKMFLIGMGQGEWNWTTVDEAAEANPHFFNLEFPSNVDTIYSSRAFMTASWTVVRYQVEFPRIAKSA